MAAMEQDPIHAAEHDHAVRQAALERARAKLAAARSATQCRAEIPTFSPVYSFIKGSVFLVIAAGALIHTAMADPEHLHPAAWLSVPAVPIVLLFVVSLPVYALFWLRRRRAMHEAEHLVRDFYRAVSSKHDAFGLEQRVVDADFDAAPRRTPALHPEDDVLPCIGGGKELNWYWTNLLKPDGKRRFRTKVQSVRLLDLEDDLKLAQVKLRVSRQPDDQLLSSAIVTIFVGLMMLPAQYPWLEEDGRRFWVASMLIAPVMLAGYWWANRKPGTFRVRKLVVHSGGKWKLFCGDWEGWEEADLSWLDETSS